MGKLLPRWQHAAGFDAGQEMEDDAAEDAAEAEPPRGGLLIDSGTGELKLMAWVVVDGTVYDMTEFIKEESGHPGGDAIPLEYGGKDASEFCAHPGPRPHPSSCSALQQPAFCPLP